MARKGLTRIIIEVDESFANDFDQRIKSIGTNKKFVLSNLMKKWMENIDRREGFYGPASGRLKKNG
jgi:hypothetical protein